ncbi:ATP-binding protein [Pseudoduganella sp. UC29_106]|uniref:ATP-binding protein n=1 Tax=Pseudoduganella sp. UC29_106 TaxID=3374553 RepID=UPI003757D68A
MNASPSTVLIVDDTPANVRVLAEYLDGHGFTVTVAQDGEEGLERARFGCPDLILLDAMMPGWDGFETCRRLKAEPATSTIPVIFMTALSDIGDKVRAYEAGGVDYITKPFHAEEVLARINTHLSLRNMQRQLQEQNEALQREVQERQRAEQVLAERSRELARSNAELERMAYIASHDLQEPLRMVASYVQLLERRYVGQLDADAHEFIGFAVDGAKRMQALIDDLLTISRVDTKARPMQPVDLGQSLASALHSLRIAVEESQAVVEADALPVVRGDGAQLTQVFQNLLSNAIKFCQEPPRIRLSAQREGRMWRIGVADNGIGVPAEYRERIFGMFQRLHGRREYAGTGIGLAICQKIVERHGGAIWVEDAAGGGTQFVFTVPACDTEKKS